MARTFKVNETALYFTDNSAIICGKDLGASAKYSGRDISGQAVELVTPDDVKDADAMGFVMRCECCGREASRLHMAAV